MNILLDMTPAARQSLTGVGVYAAHLAKELQNIHSIHLEGCYRLSRWKNKKYIDTHCAIPVVPELPYYPEILSWRSELYHGTDFRVPAKTNLLKVVTVHDLVVFQSGLSELDFAEKSQKKFMHMMQVCKPDHVITVSQAVANELAEICPEFIGRITPIHSGIDHLPNINRNPSISPLIVFIGTIERRKNLNRIIQAFEHIHYKWPDAKLVLAGGLGNGAHEVTNAVSMSLAKDSIQVMGYISDEERNDLYASATVFIYASLYEGFGLPILEAMKAGCPVITSNNGAQAEVAEGNALLVDAQDADDIAKKLDFMLSNPHFQQELAIKGKVHAEKFTWEKCASNTTEVYTKLLAK